MMKRILIESDEILVQAINALTSCEPRFEYVLEHTGMPKLRLRPDGFQTCLLYTSPSPRDLSTSRMPSSA